MRVTTAELDLNWIVRVNSRSSAPPAPPVPTWRFDSRIGRYGRLAVLAALSVAGCWWPWISGPTPRSVPSTRPPCSPPSTAASEPGCWHSVVGGGHHALWATEPARSTIAPVSIVVFLIVGSLIVWLTLLTRTARLRAERAEHREQTVLDSITDAFVAVDFAWRYTYVNEAAQAYFGMSERELIGRNCWDVFPQAIGTPLESYYRQVMERREAIRVELPSVLKDTRWAQLHISPTAEGISVVFRDITEQRRLQGSLLRHQERLHRALEAARMAAWEYDPRLDRVTYGASASDVLGVPVDRLPHDRHTGADIIHPDDREAPRGDRAPRVAQRGRPIPIPVPARRRLPVRPPGPVWIEDRGRMLFDAVGVLTLVQGVLQDVTASRHRGTHPRPQRGPARGSRNARRCSKRRSVARGRGAIEPRRGTGNCRDPRCSAPALGRRSGRCHSSRA